jgi:exodeoxyribonuclease VII large subunit
MSMPVITGIGHERDETISDLVSHTSLKTPTAVGEFLINGVLQFDAILEEHLGRIRNEFQQKLRYEELKLQENQHQILQLFRMALRNKQYKLESIQRNLISAAQSTFSNKQMQLQNITTRLSLLDPEKILKRGYTISSINNKFLSGTGKIRKGDKLRTYTDKLIIDSTIDKSQLK